nr:MAG TPA: hypothetical protein [Bacteriophage sp.]
MYWKQFWKSQWSKFGLIKISLTENVFLRVNLCVYLPSFLAHCLKSCVYCDLYFMHST